MDIRFVINVESAHPQYSVKNLCNTPLITHSSGPNQTLRCHWAGCKEMFHTYESLYDHAGEAHIGRKRQGNLCLDCNWEGCKAKFFKRDHIMSHLKVHIPMKAFKCSKCPKAFKRAQDLTKHQRLHYGSSLEITPRMKDYINSDNCHTTQYPGFYKTNFSAQTKTWNMNIVW